MLQYIIELYEYKVLQKYFVQDRKRFQIARTALRTKIRLDSMETFWKTHFSIPIFKPKQAQIHESAKKNWNK